MVYTRTSRRVSEPEFGCLAARDGLWVGLAGIGLDGLKSEDFVLVCDNVEISIFGVGLFL